FDFFAQFPHECHKMLMMYDITPLMFWQDLGAYFLPHLYMKRFEQIYEADLILSISETVRRDVLETFGLDPEKVVNIDGGFSKKSTAVKPKGFKIPPHYGLLPTGDLPH